MPLDATAVGAILVDRVEVDSSWPMAYAAGLGDALPEYIDTTRPGGVIAHPMFPVCVEWQANIASPSPGTEALTPAELTRGVHAAHDLQLHRPVRPDETYELRREVVTVEARSSGAHLVVRTEAFAAGAPVWTSHTSTVLRDVPVTGNGSAPNDQGLDTPAVEGSEVVATLDLPIPANAALVYSACSRIWNPIHTDVAVARGAGLDGPILHGTATMALAISTILRHRGDVKPADVTRMSARFSGMVPMPTTLTVRLFSPSNGAAGTGFDVVDPAGQRVLSEGWLAWSRDGAPGGGAS